MAAAGCGAASGNVFLQRGLDGPVGQNGFLSNDTANTVESVYKGKTVMLIDERAVSSAEHTGLFFEAANGTKFVGSPTTGTNGDITYFFIPGGIGVPT